MENDKRNIVVQLQEFYSTCTQLPETLVYNPYTTIIDVPKFVQSHLTYVINNPDKRAFQPYLERLQAVREKILAMQTEKPKKTRKKGKQTEMFD